MIRTLACSGVMAAGLLLATAARGASVEGVIEPTITVSGEAVVKVVPDVIIIALGVETVGTEIVPAKEENNRRMEKLLAAVKAQGVEAKEIQTDTISVEKRWEMSSGWFQKPVGFVVRNSIAVTVKDVARVEPLITAALEAGATHLHGVDFQTRGLREYRDHARELALAAAREKAERMAATLGQIVLEPLTIEEQPNYGWYGFSSGWSGWGFGRDRGYGQNVTQEAQDAPSETGGTVALGKISIRAAVSVTFSMAPQQPAAAERR